MPVGFAIFSNFTCSRVSGSALSATQAAFASCGSLSLSLFPILSKGSLSLSCTMGSSVLLRSVQTAYWSLTDVAKSFSDQHICRHSYICMWEMLLFIENRENIERKKYQFIRVVWNSHVKILNVSVAPVCSEIYKLIFFLLFWLTFRKTSVNYNLYLYVFTYIWYTNLRKVS